MDLQSILDRWHIATRLEDIFAMWNEPHRAYHTTKHLYDLIEQIHQKSLPSREREMLVLIALFHDCIYDPRRTDNERRSADFFLESAKIHTADVQEIAQCILETETHKSSSLLSAIFCKMDMDIVKRPLADLREWERGIAFEYSFLPTEVYVRRRAEFLQKMIQNYPENAGALRELLDEQILCSIK